MLIPYVDFIKYKDSPTGIVLNKYKTKNMTINAAFLKAVPFL